VVSQVEILGTTSVPLETSSGDPLDPAKLHRDFNTLWQTQRLSDLHVETEPDGDQVRVIFRASERHLERIHKVKIEPLTPGINLGIAPGSELDERMAQQAAASAREQLISSGYPHAIVTAHLVPDSRGKQDLELHVDKKEHVDIAGVRFTGDLGLPTAELQHALRATKSKTMLPGLWHIPPGYSDDAVQSDAASLRSFYFKHGFFNAQVRAGSPEIEGGKAGIAYAVDAGPRYRVGVLRVGHRPIAVPPGGELPADAVCRELFRERRQAEREGVLDFRARLDIKETKDVAITVTRGPEYSTRTIAFRGNHSFSDVVLRRSLLLREGAPLDETLLRKSLARLNATGFFEPLNDRSVVVNTPPGAQHGDVTIWLKEKKMRNWSFSGPVGPMSVAGPLQFSIGSRLPPWGRGVLELSTYAISARLMLFAKPIGNLIPFLPNKRFIPLLTIQRPMLPGQRFLSGAEFIPQLGWQGVLAGYGASQTRDLLRTWLDTDRSYFTVLPVTIVKADGSEAGAMFCDTAKTKLDWLRQITGTASSLAFSFLPF